ncbi:hypothetical protein EOL94_02225 [bacterium]|nr:hypothetical protein [bacterium]
MNELFPSGAFGKNENGPDKKKENEDREFVFGTERRNKKLKYSDEEEMIEREEENCTNIEYSHEALDNYFKKKEEEKKEEQKKKAREENRRRREWRENDYLSRKNYDSLERKKRKKE